MAQWPLVSVIIPAYNAARFLPAAIESVHAQHYQPLEIVVVDDGSRDDTPAAVRALGGGIRYAWQDNAGPSAARNHGLRLAQGEFLAFLDADDRWPTGKISVQLARLLAEPALDAVLGRIQYVALGGCRVPDLRYEGADSTVTHVHLGSGLFRHRAFELVGPFDESLRYCEDVDWFFRAREQNLSILILRAVTLLYSIHEHNLTRERQLADQLLAPVFKKSMDRRRARDSTVRPLPRWLSYDETWPGRDPLVSVVIPAYNAEAYVREAIDSVLAQSYSPVEVVVVDDGSQDRTAEAVRGFGPRIRFCSQAHRGAGAARNLGLARASGPLVAFLDADDIWLPRKLEGQVRLLRESPDCQMVFGMVEQFRQGEEPGPAQPGYVPGAALIRREVFEQVGRFAEELRVGEFIDWYCRAKDKGVASLLLDQVVLRRRIHGGNLGAREREARADYLRVLKAAMDRQRQPR